MACDAQHDQAPFLVYLIPVSCSVQKYVSHCRKQCVQFVTVAVTCSTCSKRMHLFVGPVVYVSLCKQAWS